MERTGEQRELVYCHQCENEWYRDEHGIICPQCESEFTEVIERDHDPREPDLPDPLRSFLHNQNPWSAPDPDEEDIDNLNASDPEMRRNRQYGQERAPNQGDDLFRSFQQMINMIAGPGGAPQGPTRTFGGGAGRDGAEHANSFRPQSAPGTSSWTVRSGPGFQFTYSTTTSTGFGDQTRTGGTTTGPDGRQMPGPDINEVMAQIFGRLGAQQGQQMPFGGLFSSMMMGPGYGNFNPGDFATEGGLENIITEMMNQHDMRNNAAGPASENAINSLEKRPATAKDLGINEGQEPTCSICMDSVAVKDEIMILPCKHWFHPDCAREWLSQHDTCPICRKGIMPEDGSQTVRSPEQAPLHNYDPVAVRQRQSQGTGSEQEPIIIPDSPSANRRGSTQRGTNNASTSPTQRQSSTNSNNGDGSSMLERLRSNVIGGGNSNGQGNEGPGSNRS